MTKRMLINVVEPEEIRIAILKNNSLDELYIERTAQTRYLGNIYKARVVHLERSIQACFLNFGEKQNAFLHVSDTLESWLRSSQKNGKKDKPLYIQDLFRKGQEVLIQITKENVGNKAPTVTSCISLPGRYLVLFPFLPRRGVSKKIEDEEERRRLKELIHELECPPNMGIVARTAACNQPKKLLERDLQYLLKLWDLAYQRAKKEPAPALIYKESDLVIKTIRDVYSQDIKEIIIDEKEVYQKVRDFLKMIMPRHKRNVTLYEQQEPLFYAFGIEKEIEKVYQHKVELKSGGTIVIDQTEALVAIDVNSGRSKGEGTLEATAYKTNLEAAEEIARQLRMRDLGGLIVCDFIDMIDDRHKRAVERAFREALKEDRARIKMARMSRFCIVELTRQRLRTSLNTATYTTCPTCRGTGKIKNLDSMCVHIIREIKLQMTKNSREKITLTLHPKLANYIQNTRRATLANLEKEFNISIFIDSNPEFSLEEYRFQ
ncbi:MAG: Rne/Rng family ribonuclease [Planctomycetota bacterium]|nr:MAG: Rne/Rng family ribonuclease [Planctomycetota bacterium]